MKKCTWCKGKGKFRKEGLEPLTYDIYTCKICDGSGKSDIPMPKKLKEKYISFFI